MNDRAQAPSTHRRIYPWLALAAGVVMVLRLALSVRVFSPATDEPAHIGAAVSMIEAHKLIAPGGHPPLARLLAAIPLWLDGARLPQCRGQTTIGTEDLGYALGTQVLYQSLKPTGTLLTHARLVMLLFPAISLFYLYRLGRWLAGPPAAAAAVAFFSFDPTLLGHGFWIGNDVAACAGYLAATYYAFLWLRNPAWPRAALAGTVCGLAISTKFSCLLVIPVIALVAMTGISRWRTLMVQLPLMALIAFTTLWATYFFNLGPLGDQAGLNAPAQHDAADNPQAQSMRQQWQRLPPWVRQTPIPMPSFFLALARQSVHNRFGHLAYLNGHVSSQGWWYYFPEVLALKSPIGFLAASLIALGLFLGRRQWRDWAMRHVLLPPAVFLLAAMTSNIDIGVRYVLPAIPFLYLFAAIQLVRPGWVWVLACLMLCSALETAAVHPDYLGYFNLAAGGSSGGDRFALDSNLDWNQDVYRLADWIGANAPGRPCAIRLTGRRNAPLLRQLRLDPESLVASPHGRMLFISKNVRLIDRPLPWLARYRPIARVGDSIDVYDLTAPPNPGEPDDAPWAE
ncbi:MAG: glycosyltransferase family 39 protein [Tepidisphaeraceae bacterium]|jgi:4-amino-4-deoxy-L-arabinose transferase-like glycosyltransferase